MVFVDVESPYSGQMVDGVDEVHRNIRYARACVRDSLLRGEIPYASHLFYTQPGILDDNNLTERQLGMEAGKRIIEGLEAVTVAYTDLGISKGMKWGIKKAIDSGRSVEYRSLGDKWEEEFTEHEGDHSHCEVWGVKLT